MTEHAEALLDTSVVVDLASIEPGSLPAQAAIAAITLAELAAGPHAAVDEEERVSRQDRLQWVSATFNPLPFDAEAARMYGRIFAATRAAGRPRRARLANLLIAATAAANGLPLYTRNPADFAGLEQIVTVVAV
jgi:predicted nucleic acid-binding protein